jgi:hypothetical protein
VMAYLFVVAAIFIVVDLAADVRTLLRRRSASVAYDKAAALRRAIADEVETRRRYHERRRR